MPHTIKINGDKPSKWPSRPKMTELLDRSAEDSFVTGTIAEYKNDRVTSIGDYAFSSCAALTTVNFPSATSIGDYAFSKCTALTTVDIPSATSIGDYAFSSCAALTTVNFPSATSIEEGAFFDCAALTTVDIPSATSIGDYAFRKCTALTTVNFPSATSIGVRAFDDCAALTTVILRADSVCTLRTTNSFYNTPIASGTGYIYVPSALVDTYKAAANWSTHADQFRALEDYTVDGTTTGALDETKI